MRLTRKQMIRNGCIRNAIIEMLECQAPVNATNLLAFISVGGNCAYSLEDVQASLESLKQQQVIAFNEQGLVNEAYTFGSPHKLLAPLPAIVQYVTPNHNTYILRGPNGN